jgi:hypothetical protein
MIPASIMKRIWCCVPGVRRFPVMRLIRSDGSFGSDLKIDDRATRWVAKNYLWAAGEVSELARAKLVPRHFRCDEIATSELKAPVIFRSTQRSVTTHFSPRGPN